MKVLVLNCGSSSIRAAVFDGDRAVAQALIERIGAGPRIRLDLPSRREHHAPEADGQIALLDLPLPRLERAVGGGIGAIATASCMAGSTSPTRCAPTTTWWRGSSLSGSRYGITPPATAC